MNWQEKLLRSFIAKVVGTLLLCFLGSVMFVSGVGYLMRYELRITDSDTTFYETASFRQEVENLGHAVYPEYLNIGKVDSMNYGPFFYIELYEMKDGVENKVASFSPDCEDCKVVYTKEVLIEAGDMMTSQFYMQKLNLDESSDPEQILAKVKISAIEMPNDAMYRGIYILERKQMFDFAKKFTTNDTIPLFVCTTIAFILTFLFMLFAAGHVFGEDGIHLNWFDRLPVEIASLICSHALFIGISLLKSTPYNWEGIIFVVFVDCIFIYIGLFFLLWSMSVIVRIKSKTLFKGSLVYKIFHMLFVWLKMIPYVWKTVFFAFCYWIYQIVVLSVMGCSPNFGVVYFFFHTAIVIGVIYLSFIMKKVIACADELASGNLEHRVQLDFFKYVPFGMRQLALDLNSLGEGMNFAIAKQLKSERLKAELIANVSHDIKTPLTSIINYIDLLQKDHTEEEQKEYLEVLDRQSQRLKKLTEDVVEASKASTGNLSYTPESINLKELLDQSLAEFEEKFNKNDLEVISKIYDEKVQIFADGRLMWRTFSNILSNIVKYAQPHTRVYVDVSNHDDQQLCISFKNISKDPLNIDAQELLERFVRGDASRHTEGSGLGLNIAKSLMELQKGSLQIVIDGDLFRIDLFVQKKAVFSVK